MQQVLEDQRCREILERAVEVEKENGNGWRLEQVGPTGSHLNKLKAAGMVETVIERSSKANWYQLADPAQVKSTLEDIENLETQNTVTHDWDYDLPEFDAVVGLDDVKFIVQKAITAEKRVNVLLAGPPSVAKSIILMEIEQAVPNAAFGYGSEDSAAGLIDLLFDR